MLVFQKPSLYGYPQVIAFLFRPDQNDQIEEKILNLSCALKNDFDIHVIMLCSDMNAPDLCTENFARHDIQTQRILAVRGFSFKTCRAIREVLSHLGVTVLHTHGVEADFFGRFLKSEKLSWVTSIHSAESHAKLNQVKKTFHRWCLKNADWMVFPNRHIQEKVGGDFNKDKMSVIPWGVTRPKKSDFYNLKNTLFVGPLVPGSGCEKVIRAFALIKSVEPQSSLQILGEGAEREKLERLVKTLDLGHSVAFLQETEKNLLNSFAETSIFIYTHQDSVLRKSFLLAMSAGCAIVALRHVVVAEYLVDGDSALLVPKGDVFGLSMTLKKLINDAALRQKLSTRAEQIFNEKFTLEIMAEKYRVVYRMFQ